jgi:phage baseplate assembly protein W
MLNENTRDLVGSGWAFPLRVDKRGGIALSRNDTDIQEAIRVILSTAKGERRMRPDFGCDIHTLLFAPNNDTTSGLAAHYVREALGWWEPRIEVTAVDPHPDPGDQTRLLIDIRYTIKATNDERSIVYPFYILTGRE